MIINERRMRHGPNYARHMSSKTEQVSVGYFEPLEADGRSQ